MAAAGAARRAQGPNSANAEAWAFDSQWSDSTTMVYVRGKRSFEEFFTGVREPPLSGTVNYARDN
eukprot:808693-Rhodomonas_salina.1